MQLAAPTEKTRASAAKRATRTERAGEAARERACKGSGDEVPGVIEDSSSIGRAPVSKTGGWGFDSLLSCQFGEGRTTERRTDSERSEPTRTERAVGAASERACRGVRGAKPLGKTSPPVSKTGGWGFDSLLSCQLESPVSSYQSRMRLDVLAAGNWQLGTDADCDRERSEVSQAGAGTPPIRQ